MDLQLKNKVILITGSSKGIGHHIAQSFYGEGASLMLNSRHEAELEKVAQTFNSDNVRFCAADVTDPNECQKLVNETIKQFKEIDVLICNVGSGKSAKPGDETPKDWQQAIELNLYSTTNMITAAKQKLGESQGSVVCISSICGQETLGAPATYSAAKAALNSYVRSIARPLAQMDVRINAIAPGNILFEGSTWEKKLAENKDQVKAMLNDQVALKRLGTPEEIASFAVFLASNKASFATGEIFTVDGGQVRS